MESRSKLHTIFLLLEAFGISCFINLSFRVLWPIFQNPFVYWKNLLFWLIIALISAIMAYLIRRMNGGWGWKDIGFKVHRSWMQDIWYGIVAFSALYIVIIPTLFVILPTHSKMMSDEALLQTPLYIALIIFTGKTFTTGFFTGALHEEIRFRGYIQSLFSREISPAVGFFVSFIPFSFGHYFSHPEWNILQTLNTILPGIAFCLSFYATGSLIVSITVHALCNLIPLYAPYVHSRGYPVSSYIIIILIAIASLLILMKGKEEFKHLVGKTKELFSTSGFSMSIFGICTGIVFFLLPRGRNLIINQLGLNDIQHTLFLLALTLILIFISFLTVHKTKMNRNQ